MCWSRGNSFDAGNVASGMTRKDLFSLCGKLIGHYPVASWLRVACGFIKRNSGGTQWSDAIGINCEKMMNETLTRLQNDDPVRGVWTVAKNSNGVVWCDASSLALGVVIEIGGAVVEDASSLRPKDDVNHINVAELDAVLKGINLGYSWGLDEMKIMTDSATVAGWIQSVLSDSRRIRVHGISEVLVKRRLGIVKEMVEKSHLRLSISLVRSCDNLADVLTRVPQKWIQRRVAIGSVGLSIPEIGRIHDRHHFGLKKTLYFVKAENAETNEDDVRHVVETCKQCLTIDPNPVRWEKGSLEVEESWSRLAIDVTHFGGVLFLTLIDCGPSRFAIWRKLAREDANSITTNLDEKKLMTPPRKLIPPSEEEQIPPLLY